MKGPNEIVPFDHPYIQYPQLCSTKYDGFRCLNLCGERLLSPALKDFPNKHLAKHLEDFLVYCHEHRIVTDGEIWSPLLKFNELQSVVRSQDVAIPTSVSYYIFDMIPEMEWDNEIEKEFHTRFSDYLNIFESFPNVVPVLQVTINNAQEAEDCFNSHIEQGHEGIILRQPKAKYKHGRCTTKQDGLWKFKQFITHDAVIVGVEEQMKLREGVERTRNEVGHLERRYEQDLYEPAGMVGAFVVEHEGQRFKVKPGKGYDNTSKICMWQDKESLIGKLVEFKFMPHGSKDKPRIGSLVRFRPDLD